MLCNSEELITITKKEYESLINDALNLAALKAGGVDNWEWYYDSLKNAGLLEEDED